MFLVYILYKMIAKTTNTSTAIMDLILPYAKKYIMQNKYYILDFHGLVATSNSQRMCRLPLLMAVSRDSGTQRSANCSTVCHHIELYV